MSGQRKPGWWRRSVPRLTGERAVFGSSLHEVPADIAAASLAPRLERSSGVFPVWATEGTRILSSTFPDPFELGADIGPMLTCGVLPGSCVLSAVVRRDISGGQPGLPLRVLLRIIDGRARAIPHASVELWHCAPPGPPPSGGAGAPGEFRGAQPADGNGRVEFNTCFPGWCPGRTVHIGVTIRVGNEAFAISELLFEDTLCDTIIASEPPYADRGVRDTDNAKDPIVRADRVRNHLLAAARQPDGSLLAWKTILLLYHPQGPADSQPRCDGLSNGRAERAYRGSP
jgi:protocatechuate 3,4-dioxygenase beta subunit